MDQATAIEELRERYARGGVPLDEFRQLMGTLMVTTDPVECQAIIDRLPPETFVSSPRSEPVRSAQPRSAQAHRISALFGSVDRSGQLWDLGPETEVSALCGEVRLDVRMARLTPGENLLKLHAMCGEISVVVPQGLRVYIDSQARFGEVSTPGHEVAGITGSDSTTLGSVEGASYLRIEAIATFGEIRIRAR